MIDEPLFYLAAVPAVLITGISKTGLGGGLGIVAVPLMALVISPVQAAGVMLPILCVMDAMSVWAFRRSWDRWNVIALLPSAIAGIVLGTLTFRYLNADAIRLLLGAIAVAFTLHTWLRRAAAPGDGSRPGRTKMGIWGAAAGFTAFVAHSGFAPISMALLPQRLDKTLFVGTTVMFFAAMNYLKIVPYGMLGLLDGTNLMTALVLSPLVPVGILFGLWLLRRTPEGPFYRIVYALVFITGCKLLWDGFVGLALS